MSTKILIGCDFSEESKVAIETGIEWAKILKCDPVVLYIEERKSESKELAEGLHEKLVNEISSVITDEYAIENCRVEFGPKETVLALEIKRTNAKILVLGTRSESNLRNKFLGTTTENALKNVTIPILAVKDEKVAKPIRLLWALDLTEITLFTFEWIKILAGYFKASVMIANVVSAKDYDKRNKRRKGLDSLFDEEIGEQIQLYIEELRREGIEVDAILRPNEGQSIVEVIESMADETESDLVIMGSHSRKGIKKLLLGSVTENSISKGTKSVFIIKNPS